MMLTRQQLFGEWLAASLTLFVVGFILWLCFVVFAMPAGTSAGIFVALLAVCVALCAVPYLLVRHYGL